MSTDQLELFRESWSKAEQYSLSLNRLHPNLTSLRLLKKHLDASSPNLFRSSSKVVVLELNENWQRQGTSSVYWEFGRQ
jgi:hypothetical protein